MGTLAHTLCILALCLVHAEASRYQAGIKKHTGGFATHYTARDAGQFIANSKVGNGAYGEVSECDQYHVLDVSYRLSVGFNPGSAHLFRGGFDRAGERLQ